MNFSQINQKILFFILTVLITFSVSAQLSDLHYLPPLKQGENNAGIREQAVYLSTPEPTAFTVNAYRGTGTTPVATFSISNVSPAVYSMSNGDNNIILVNNANTGVVLTNSGLRFESPSGSKFYVNYRGSSTAQSASLTSKGRVAMGTKFKWGGVPNLGSHSSKSNTLGIMATEDNTVVDLFGYDPDCEFRVGANRAGITANTYQVTLNANESFVFETYIGTSPTFAHQEGWIGASIESTKDIVISNGSMNFGRQANAGNRDAGIDQPVPENRLGKEYVFVRGNGNTNGSTEFPLMIATADNTQIFVNGSTIAVATINNGDFFQIPSSYYSSNTVGANMLVTTSKDVYAYQCLAGASAVYTQGLNFVAPVNCLLPDVMDNIPDIRNMAGTTVTGGLTIIAAVNTPDANITVTDGGGAVSLPASVPVAGSTDWKTFYVPNLNGNVSVQSTGPMAIGFFGYNGARGVAGYFSGFDTVPEVTLEIVGESGCFVGSSLYEATGNFDAYQWYGDGVLIPGENSPTYAPTVAGDYFIRGTKGPCTYDSQPISAFYCDPDVVVNKTVDKSEIVEGETATFSIHVRNLGVGPITNLNITDNIPSGLTLVSNFTITGSWSGNTWNIGTLLGGESAVLELEVVADEIATLPLKSFTNTVTNTQDQVDANISEDNPTAILIAHNDFDNDGIIDTVDLDDDNDGIYDSDECANLAFNIASGNSFTSDLSTVEDYLVFDVFSLNNSFNLQINGTDVAGEIQFQSGAGNYVRFLDGTGYGESGNPDVWSIPGSIGNPLIRVVVNEAGELQLFGARTSNGTLEPLVLTNPATTISWNSSGNNNIIIGQAQIGATNLSGSLLTIACDEDADGLQNHLDLDSDDDGCSDANEFYKDENADGGDGGEYGAGVPVVDSSNGAVTTASYTRILAPEILLGNTSEDLGGTDINGQNVSLGQTFEYVLRFQNTGDDAATNYTITNVLPNNVTVDNVDVSGAPGVTYNPVITNQTLVFQVPDGLVEIGDPEYSIRIQVTIALNCSDFITACSSTLENIAYSTYQGVTNTTTFSDQDDTSYLAGCPVTKEVASNSILNDLTQCNQARTIQLCGDDVTLAAGTGFNNYNWVLDTNGNGQVDASDTVLNDGDPDANPSTLVVTTIGDYIVEKTSDGTCPDLVEYITVERFGSVQTNPIVDYFNQVNSDANPDNDLQGEIVSCSVDADVLPKFFLCGANDEATIQLGITDAQSILWEKLDEASCADSGDDCANKNGSCSWSVASTADNFTLTESGEYRVVILYQNGCFSRFYFNVFKNELDLEYDASDILCTTAGNIRITNIGSGYGFQLINTVTDAVVVPFSANNGPNFDINTSGSYRVQVTLLDPLDNTPLSGTCIFETEDIGILEKNFSVNVSATASDCNDLGTITVQALDAAPYYSYELRLDDGSNGGDGSPVVAPNTINDNTYKFSNVNPGDYLVVTRTEDGCLDTQAITVNSVPKLNLVAASPDNITCTAGVVNLTPSGGLPSPDYEMAIWSKDGIPLYTDPSLIPAAALQTTETFLFGYRGSPSVYFPNEDGEYVFVVKDGNGCYGYSNAIQIEDLGSVSISGAHSTITCADSATATLTVSATGGTAPYQYSLDGGTTYQTVNTFANLAAGLYTITVLDSSNSAGTGCVETLEYEVDQPFRLTASASIVEDASCSANGALVKIINANGGVTPYTYSFDGGSTFNAINELYLSPGNHDLVVQDALGCTFDMEMNVPISATDPTFTSAVIYDCAGLGTVTITPDNTTDFSYTYGLNSTANTPADSPVFASVVDGTHTVTIGYSSAITPNQSTLFLETFGAGVTTQIGEIGPGYCYEPQDGTETTCNLGPAGILVNGEYTVTNFVTNPVPAWRSPNDHTGVTDGRFLAIDVSTLAGDNGILWARRGVEVLPNRDITLSFWAYNLMIPSGNGNNPEVLVELVDGLGNVISSAPTNEIPKNGNADDWHNREVTLNPGINTSVDIVFRTNLNSDYGNDLVLDDIQANQVPEVCEKTSDVIVVVEDNKEFSVALLGTINPSCNGASDGAVRFEVSNFDTATGFEYSTDGGSTWIASLVSPITTSATLADGTYTIDVRKANETSCIANFAATITEPTSIVPQLSQTADFTCFNTGATLKASATGGSPGYEYQLENSTNVVIRAYQTTDTFNNVPAGDYVVRVKDVKDCEVVSATLVTVIEPTGIVFGLTATQCYDGLNNATVTAAVTAGNGVYQFRIDGGAWLSPATATDTSFTFSGLAEGSFDVEVTDQYGCVSSVESITIDATLQAQIETLNVSACADGSISVTASGGDTNYSYAFVTTGTTILDAHFGAANTFAVTNATVGSYDVYVRDNNNVSPYCQLLETVSVTSDPVLALTAVPTDAICYGDSGSIAVNITSGKAPFSYELVDVDHGTSSQTQSSVSFTTKTYFNLTPGSYTVIITDANSCTETVSGVTVAEPDELVATITGITPATCTGDVNDFGFAFNAYPTSLGAIEFSADGGTTWIGNNSIPGTSDQLTGFLSGDTVYPSMRTTDGLGTTVCQVDLAPYIIPYPLDDLDISLTTVIVNCTELQVKVQGSEGTAPYEYAFSDYPGNFNTATATWIPGGSIDIDGLPVAAGSGMYEWIGLIPGKTYVFYVRDSSVGGGCVRQSSVNVNDITTLPMDIVAEVTPSCSTANNGEITYTITDTDGSVEPNMNWTLFDVDDNVISTSGGNISFSNTINITGLSPNEYYIVVAQVDAGGTSQCTSGSENAILEELDPITATLNPVQDISCEAPGIIAIENIQGGGGTYNYTVSGPVPFVTITATTDNPIEIAANSPAGSYVVSISDQYGCSVPLGSVALNLAANPTISGVNIDNCNPTATVNITATTVSGTLQYSIDAGASYVDNGGVFTNVAEGNYTVFVKNESGCTDSMAIVVEPTLQAKAVLAESLGCGVGNEAEIDIEVIAGSGTYEYEILSTTGTQVARQVLATATITELITVADTYTVTIFDTSTNAPECSRSFIVEVPAAVVPDFTIATPTHISCFGETDGAIVITENNNGNNPLTYSISPNLGTFNAATKTFENLPRDVYEITATGQNGCTTVLSNIPIFEPNDITFDAPTVVPFGCSSGNTMNNATITVDTGSINGGTTTYVRYVFEDSPSGTILQDGSATSYVYTDLSGGDVIVTVYDDHKCSGSQTVTVPAYDALGTPTVHIDDAISCVNGGEDISIDITSVVTNYTANPGNYEFKLLPSVAYQASNQFPDLQPGSYTFVVKNINTGCEVTVAHEVKDPNTFSVTVEKLSDVVCFGDDGSVRFSITDAVYAGGFTWNIYDTQGTPADRSDDGASVLTGVSPNLGPTVAINIGAGNYIVEVTQDGLPNCGQIRSFSITTPTQAIALATIELEDVGCSNDMGSALISPTGGVAPYDMVLTNTTTAAVLNATQVNANLFQGLSYGVYTVRVTDALGCVIDFTNEFELLNPNPISGTQTPTTLDCIGDTDANISFSVNPRNVTTTYRYILNQYTDNVGTVLLQSSASQTTDTFNNLGSGFYNITVLDAMGCSFDSIIIEIVEPIETNAMLVTTQALGCTVGAELLLTASGGSAPYTWSTDGITFNTMNETSGANTHLFQNVSVGNYQYYIRDVNDCVSIISNEIIINPIENLAIGVDTSAAIINCTGESSAIINANASGGLGNYQYGLFADATLVTAIRPYQSTGLFTDLPAGNYYVSVQSEDCQETTAVILIEAPLPLIVNPEITNISCNGEADGSVLLDVEGGSGVYQFAISPNLNQFDDENSFDELEPGDYTIIVQDSKGCFEVIEITITEPDVLEMEGTATPEICAGNNDGTIEVIVTGGTAPFSTSVNSNSDADFVEGRLIFDSLAGGNYIIFVKDANGCIVNQTITVENGANLNAEVEVIYECAGDTPNNRIEITLEDGNVATDVIYGLNTSDPANMVLDADFENIAVGEHSVSISHANGCIRTYDFEIESFEPLLLELEQRNLNEITAVVTGGKEDYVYYFDGIENGDNNTYFINRTDDFTVRVVDANGCESIATIYMEFIDIEIPNFFTPDGDGQNDLWIPRNIEQFPNIWINVFDRYGRLVYRLEDSPEGWDGFYNQNNLPTGDYWYIIKLNGANDIREFVGNFTLYR